MLAVKSHREEKSKEGNQIYVGDGFQFTIGPESVSQPT